MVGFSHNGYDASIFCCEATIPPSSRASFETVSGMELADRSAAVYAGGDAPVAVHAVVQLSALPGDDKEARPIIPARDLGVSGSACTHDFRR